MTIYITLPPTLRPEVHGAIPVEGATTLEAVIEALDGRFPGIGSELSRIDSGFNFAVNDEMLLAGTRAYELKDGDRLEVVPALSGG
jgi:molybdopterin converting factor small subunit